jgi:hypothetical protein
MPPPPLSTPSSPPPRRHADISIFAAFAVPLFHYAAFIIAAAIAAFGHIIFTLISCHCRFAIPLPSPPFASAAATPFRHFQRHDFDIFDISRRFRFR